MAKKKRVAGLTGTRNHLHNHPLLRKGGTHQQNSKAKRRQEKVSLRREWPQVSATPLTCGHFARAGNSIHLPARFENSTCHFAFS